MHSSLSWTREKKISKSQETKRNHAFDEGDEKTEPTRFFSPFFHSFPLNDRLR